MAYDAGIFEEGAHNQDSYLVKDVMALWLGVQIMSYDACTALVHVMVAQIQGFCSLVDFFSLIVLSFQISPSQVCKECQSSMHHSYKEYSLVLCHGGLKG